MSRRRLAGAALLVLLVTSCSRAPDAAAWTPFQERLADVVVDHTAAGLDLSEPGLGPRRPWDALVAELTLRRLDSWERTSVFLDERVDEDLAAEGRRRRGDPAFAALLYEAALVARDHRRAAATVEAQALAVESAARAGFDADPTRASVAGLQSTLLARLALGRLGSEAELPCGPFATPLPIEVARVVRTVDFGACDEGAPRWPLHADGVPPAVLSVDDLVRVLLHSGGDPAAVAERLVASAPEHGIAPHAVSFLAACDARAACSDLFEAARQRLRLVASTGGSGAEFVEAGGFDDFAENALVRAVAFPAGAPFTAHTWTPQVEWGLSRDDVDGDRAARQTAAADDLMAATAVAAPADPREAMPLLGLALGARPGLVGGLTERYGTCAFADEHRDALGRSLVVPPGVQAVPPLARVGLALDVKAALRCGVAVPRTFDGARREQLLMSPPSPGSTAEAGGLHDAWASVEAACLLDGEPPPFAGELASSAGDYLEALRGVDFTYDFRVLDTFAAHNVRAIAAGGCTAGSSWFRALW
ncbi:hypothetical protein [Nocardioides perillae]|uniref:Uncharacterized protein n=1 Tax=Nocardioides perillae TaxID=1119534 RepID=A0A7Y9RTK9_9ACTN|nr:hypothetical protein [Nocardioides perillae]NYG55051.1 hypothetical protein [Nocardioides perillae]